MKFKRGQEEIVGFVVIVVLIAVIVVIFLGIALRRGEVNSQESTDIYQFLESMNEYTTSCSISYENNYQSLGEVMGRCFEGEKCFDGTSTCDVANRTSKEILDRVFVISNETQIIGYNFEVDYVQGEENEPIIRMAKGSCTEVRGAEYIRSHSPGAIISNLELCY